VETDARLISEIDRYADLYTLCTLSAGQSDVHFMAAGRVLPKLLPEAIGSPSGAGLR
jgi:hypothetical protein